MKSIITFPVLSENQSYRVVHQSLDTAQGGGVEVGLGGLPVQPRQQVQEAGEALRLHEPGHEAVRLGPQGYLETVETPAPLDQLLIVGGELELRETRLVYYSNDKFLRWCNNLNPIYHCQIC